MAKNRGAQLFGELAKATNLSESALTVVVGQVAQLTDKERADLFQFAGAPSTPSDSDDDKGSEDGEPADVSGTLRTVSENAEPTG